MAAQEKHVKVLKPRKISCTKHGCEKVRLPEVIKEKYHGVKQNFKFPSAVKVFRICPNKLSTTLCPSNIFLILEKYFPHQILDMFNISKIDSLS